MTDNINEQQMREDLMRKVQELTARIRETCSHQWLRHPEADEGWWCIKCRARRDEDDPPTE